MPQRAHGAPSSAPFPPTLTEAPTRSPRPRVRTRRWRVRAVHQRACDPMDDRRRARSDRAACAAMEEPGTAPPRDAEANMIVLRVRRKRGMPSVFRRHVPPLPFSCGAIQDAATGIAIRSNQTCDRSARCGMDCRRTACLRLIVQRRPPDQHGSPHHRQRVAISPPTAPPRAHASER